MLSSDLRQEVVKASKIVGKYLSVPVHIGGGMKPEAAYLWGYLLAIQNANDVAGDILEIGVFKGWGLHIPGHYLRKDEKLVLVDITEHHLELSQAFLIENVDVPVRSIEKILVDSATGTGFTDCIDSSRKLRWIHIDGEHSYAAVLADLDAAARFASSEAIICVDDVDHPLAPGINDALRDWLSTNTSWRLLLRGYNKAYLISTRSHVPWKQYVEFLPEVFNRFFSSRVLLASQTHSCDSPYFSYGEPFHTESYLKVNKAVAGLEEFEGINPRSFLLGQASKPRVLIFGNCQMKVVHGALTMASSHAGMDVCFEYVADVHELQKSDVESLSTIAKRSTGMVCQQVTGSKFLVRTSDLIELLPHPFTITVPSMHFNAYWPNHADLQMDSASEHCMPVDTVMYLGIERGWPEQKIIELLTCSNLYSSEDILGWFSEAVLRLKTRERSSGIDVCISDYLTDNARKERLFYIFNHPKRKVLDFMVRGALAKLAEVFEPRYLDAYNDIISGNISLSYDMSMIDFIDIPPIRSVFENLDISPDSDLDSVYRFKRPRGSGEVHSRVSISEEIRFVRDRFASLSKQQRLFNMEKIERTSRIPRTLS